MTAQVPFFDVFSEKDPHLNVDGKLLKVQEDLKREWSVYKKLQNRYLLNGKSRNHITSKTKPSTSTVNSFQPLTSAIKSSIPDVSNAFWSTSALQILLHVHQFQHKTQEYIHSPRLIQIKNKINQTENCNLQVISASSGYVKFMRLLPLVQF